MTNYESTTVGEILLWCRGGNVVISFEVSQKSKPNKNQPNFIWIYWVWRPLWKSCKTAARRTAIWLWDASFKKCATEMCDGQIRRTPCKGGNRVVEKCHRSLLISMISLFWGCKMYRFDKISLVLIAFAEFWFLMKIDPRKDTQKVQSRVFKNDAISLDRIQILHFSGSQNDSSCEKKTCV